MTVAVVAKNRFTTLQSRVAVIPRASSMLPMIGASGLHFEGVTDRPHANGQVRQGLDPR